MESSPPESGFRIEVARAPEADGPPWHYTGLARTPSTTYDVTAIVNVDGTVRVEMGVAGEGPRDDSGTAAPPRLVRTVASLVRSACASVEIETTPAPPPHRIVRWHGDR
jgi:hypothetical protein